MSLMSKICKNHNVEKDVQGWVKTVPSPPQTFKTPLFTPLKIKKLGRTLDSY